MRIEELVLEGFKSYPVRTTITDWDPSFNAITGLNGSGKSNILDAICFVLGITNMSQMRAQNQQDLIYKRGQAGVTKASVTIVFDNSDRATSPVGLENCRQITVTRQIALPNISKYLLNGHKSQQHTIQTLFQSVQLNINNPNFLIMQGKITKVLNMRPPEILGMVEEAAGTRMFEERKEKAEKTMAKKDKRVQEIASLLAEEIAPKLDGLRAEKRAFVRFQKVASELERAGRVLRAHEHFEATDRAEAKRADADAKKAEARSLEEGKETLEDEIAQAEEKVAEITAKRDKELKKGGRYKKLEEEVAELDKALTKLRTQVEIKRETMASEEEKLGKLGEERNELEDSLEGKRAHAAKLDAALQKVKEDHSATQSTLDKDEELLQSLLTGLGGGSGAAGAGGGYMGQLADAQQRLAHAAAEEQQARVKLTMARKELAALEKKWAEVEREAGEGRAGLERMRKEVEALRTKATKGGWSEEKDRAAQEALRAAKENERRAEQDLEAVRGRLHNLHFDYSLPNPNFDRASVKGLVATLISLDKENFNTATALEITAGGKLYNVVVQDERVGKELLQNGRLKKRVTIIPLNKISASRITPQRLEAAISHAPGKARLALELVGYPAEVARAMSFVFGDTVVCDDAPAAKEVTFKGGMRAVTLQGDVYDPSGTLSGGAAPSGSGTLLRVQELLGAERALGEAKAKMDALKREEEKGRAGREAWKAVSRELEMKEHEEKLLAEQVEGSNAARVRTDIERLQATIADLEATLTDAQARQKSAKDECKKLEKDMAEFKDNKEGKIDELKKSITKQKAVLQKHNVVLKTHQKEAQTAALELEGIESDLEGHDAKLQEARDAIQEIQDALADHAKLLEKQESLYRAADKKLQDERAKLSHFDESLKQLEGDIKERKQEIADGEMKIEELKHEAQALVKERATLINFIANLEKQWEWIAEEKDSFGQPGTNYDFSKVDIQELKQTAVNLEAEQKGMKKKVNPRAVSMLDNVEKRETSLKKNMTTVLKDKEKIVETIEELDRYKRDALRKTWEKVNGDFGGIFAELLPGNFAKLQPPDGQDLTQGLEVKVQLGSVWKQSLTELSGGQRSLIALSLIMSLLQFKPAPMYILDEIDAALDLSHTQHIGQLFRTRFKGSQFIVVSLKEGLFTNANVLFRTRFRDGTSIVERTAHRSASSLYERDNDGDGSGAARRSRRT